MAAFVDKGRHLFKEYCNMMLHFFSNFRRLGIQCVALRFLSEVPL